MDAPTPHDPTAAARNWPDELYDLLARRDVRHASYVPDAGHSGLISRFVSDPGARANVLTTEEEGIAIASGAWLGGKRSVVLMQSSGVGNCINMLSLPVLARIPLLLLVTMRGEWAEFNPWQVPMGHATEPSLNAIGITTMRADTPTDLIATVAQAITMAFDADQQIAILMGQRLLGEKQW
ncbi:MAG: phosphonopyruvate decarboxylase [Pseudomonadota bacterium]